MAKGKHAPAKGAIREDKVIHPKSRKAMKMHAKEQRKLKLSGKSTIGGMRLQILSEKLLWFHENLSLVLEENVEVVVEQIPPAQLEMADSEVVATALAQLARRAGSAGEALALTCVWGPLL